jgi:hypothetical protein
VTTAGPRVAVRQWWPLFEQVTDRIAERFPAGRAAADGAGVPRGAAVSGRTRKVLVAGGAGRASQPRANAAAAGRSGVGRRSGPPRRGSVCRRAARPSGCGGDLRRDRLRQERHRSVGVQRQDSGTAGRIENSRVAVFLSYASPRGRALIDRRFCVPRSWIGDSDRCADAGIPGDPEFVTRPQLAWDMIADALDAGIRVGLVTGDKLIEAAGALAKAANSVSPTASARSGKAPSGRTEIGAERIRLIPAVGAGCRVGVSSPINR